MGAGVANILKLLSKEYMILILIANLIAWPLAWYLSGLWLDNFAYRINIGVDLFALTLLIALLIALLTVSFQSLKAALMNPVDSLRRD